MPETKVICPKCKEEKILEKDFSKHKNRENGYYVWCLKCTSKLNKISYGKHKEKVLKRTSEYNKKVNYEYQRRWGNTHKDLMKIRSLRSRCKRTGIETMSEKEFMDWFSAQKPVCSYCGIPEEKLKDHNLYNFQTGKRLGVDRKDPKKGYIKGNVTLACSMCNSVKSNVLTFEEMKEVGQKYIKPKNQVLK
jgi:hypothetical protein